jgi:hypothetical protein
MPPQLYRRRGGENWRGISKVLTIIRRFWKSKIPPLFVLKIYEIYRNNKIVNDSNEHTVKLVKLRPFLT